MLVREDDRIELWAGGKISRAKRYRMVGNEYLGKDFVLAALQTSFLFCLVGRIFPVVE